jgi:hypothetical protein
MSETQAPFLASAPTFSADVAATPGMVKYVVILRGGREVPVIIPAECGMEHVTLGLCGHVVSAGFANTVNWKAAGESLSLGIKSRPEHDTLLLRKYFQL